MKMDKFIVDIDNQDYPSYMALTNGGLSIDLWKSLVDSLTFKWSKEDQANNRVCYDLSKKGFLGRKVEKLWKLNYFTDNYDHLYGGAIIFYKKKEVKTLSL